MIPTFHYSPPPADERSELSFSRGKMGSEFSILRLYLDCRKLKGSYPGFVNQIIILSELGGHSDHQFHGLAFARGIIRRSLPLRLSLPLLLSGM